jgi:hypothetical protein
LILFVLSDKKLNVLLLKDQHADSKSGLIIYVLLFLEIKGNKESLKKYSVSSEKLLISSLDVLLACMINFSKNNVIHKYRKINFSITLYETKYINL